MKLFKKLFSVVALCISCVILAASVGCNTLSEGDGWTEVQSITYTTESGTTTLTSECEWNTNSIIIDKSEYDSIPDEEKNSDSVDFPYYISVDRKDFVSKANEITDKIYYYTGLDINDQIVYVKSNPRYTIKYVKVKVISDKVVEIDFKNEVKQISTLSYEITYFEN